MNAGFPPTRRAHAHPYRGVVDRSARVSRPGDAALGRLIFWITCLLLGLCLLRVACGSHEEGWGFERCVALAFSLILVRSICRTPMSPR
jgi:hypothetical protein